MVMKKIETNRRYVNVHTGTHCRVVAKIFFNVQYKEDGDSSSAPCYCHYKRFRKNWVEEVEDK